MLSGKRIAVTGSSGFVGSRLVRRIREQGGDVIEMDLKHGTDVTEWDHVEGVRGIDALVHLAAKTLVPESFQRPRGYFQTNISGVINALDLCRNEAAKMIFASSSYVYGHPRYLPIDESHPCSPSTPYGVSKVVGEDLCCGYHRSFGVSVIITRPFNIYGPGQTSDSLIASMIDQARTGRIVLKDPTPRRDFVFVDDVVDAYLSMIECASGFEIFNIGTGRSYSVQQISDTFRDAMRQPVEVQFTAEKRKDEIEEMRADISKARTLLGWEPKVDIASGIRRTIEAND